MSTPIVWGSLPKAQDDSQTIAQAIVAAIAAHNDDPDSHMAAGQSIDVHRTNDILDHPQASVLSDKTSSSEFILQDNFNSNTVWNTSNATKLSGNYGLNFYPTSPSGSTASLTAGIPFWNDIDFGTKEIVLQFGMIAVVPSGLQFALFGAGTDWLNISSAGLGLKVTSTSVQLYQETYPTRHFGTAFSIDPSTAHIYRIHLSPSRGTVCLYIDGNLVDTMSIYLGDDSNTSDSLESRIMKNGASSLTAQISIFNLYLSHQS